MSGGQRCDFLILGGDLILLFGDRPGLLLDTFMLLPEFIEQHGIHGLVANGIDLVIGVPHDRSGEIFSTSSATKPNWGVPSGAIS